MGSMYVVDFEHCGPPQVLKVERRPLPVLKDDEVLVQVFATTASGFDVDRRFSWKEMPGMHPLLGMECSGKIVEMGSSVTDHWIGEEVCALLNGGGYAEFVAVTSWRLLPIPKGVRIHDAATLPYATSVVWHSLFRVGKLLKNSSILVHDGAVEFGQLAIGLAKLHGCTVFASGKFRGEMEYCQALGADFCISFDENFVNSMLKKTRGKGVDFIFDPYGARVPDSLKVLSCGGTMVVAGDSETSNVRLDLGLLEKMQIKLIGVYFPFVAIKEKQQILKEIVKNVWPCFESGKLVPRVYGRRFHFFEASLAHEERESSNYQVLIVPPSSVV